MKEYRTCCDGGCFSIGTSKLTVNIPNHFGDCEQTVIAFESENEFDDWKRANFSYMYARKRDCEFKFTLFLEGHFCLFEYDCDTDTVLEQFDGRYAVYIQSIDYSMPIMALVKY